LHAGIENLSIITHFQFLPESTGVTVHKRIAAGSEGHYSDDSVGFEDSDQSAAKSEKFMIATEKVTESENPRHSAKEEVAAQPVILKDYAMRICMVHESGTQALSLLSRFLQLLRMKNNSIAPSG
jgi:hypothetical protein